MGGRRLAALTVGMVGVSAAWAWMPALQAGASGETYQAGLVTLCSTETFIRVGAVNESPLPVTITAVESRKNSTVELLNNNASDELRAIFPIVVPAGPTNAVTWDLPLPAHLNGEIRKGNDRNLHGSWLPKQWTDENGLDYKGTSGSGEANGTRCVATAPSTTAAPTTTVAPTTTTKPPTTTAAPTTVAPTTTTTVAPTTTTMAATTTTTVAPTTMAPITTTTIAPQPVEVKPVAVYSTSNSQLAARAADGNAATEFVTQMAEGAPPTWAWLNADLGQNVRLARIEWMWSAPSSADQFRIETSVDGISWSTAATPGDAPVGRWNMLQLGKQARVVRFSFRNPNGDPQLGHLAEVRFFAAPGFAPVANPQILSVAEITSRAEAEPTPASSPVLNGTRYFIKRSLRSSNSPANSAHLSIDGNSATAWQTAMTVAPLTGWTAYDLGNTAAIGEIRWKFSKIGYADKFEIQSSPDGIHWTAIAKAGNAPKANTWVSLKTSVSTRYVRFIFTNPNKDANIGYLSEVQFYPAK